MTTPEHRGQLTMRQLINLRLEQAEVFVDEALRPLILKEGLVSEEALGKLLTEF